MQIAIASVALAIVLFLCLYLGFRTGLRLGMQVAKGEAPESIKPVQAVVNTVQDIKTSKTSAEANKAFSDGFTAIMNYNGDLPKEE